MSKEYSNYMTFVVSLLLALFKEQYVLITVVSTWLMGTPSHRHRLHRYLVTRFGLVIGFPHFRHLRFVCVSRPEFLGTAPFPQMISNYVILFEDHFISMVLDIHNKIPETQPFFT